MTSLKQFIRNVRAAKTIADERAVIQKESAAIRASFREESSNPNVRRNNVAKLLYLFTLGERTHFGQIECLKLLASPRFADKRLGHLATSLLLDENQEVLTLVTNSINNDLSHSNQYIVGLALGTLGNIASVEMSRDLFADIEKLISTPSPYIRRKAALCAMRICRKVPDLQEHFVDRALELLSDRNHGVLLCGLTLLISLAEAEAEAEADDEEGGGADGLVERFRPVCVPRLVRMLKSLSSAGVTPEHDVQGIANPFLQVKALRLLRVLAVGDAETSEQIHDILAQVATNTDSHKNVGNSILYEAVRTILVIDADSSLRVLGVNILGKFLTNRDNNIRYVALNTLGKVVAIEPNAVQRHRNTILDCLRDPDVSIRRRALDLSLTLVNASNVRVLIRELLAFLEVADTEFKPIMTSQLGIAADRYAPNKRWHFDTMLRVLSLAGNHVKEPILSSFIRMIATTPELQTYAVRKLYHNVKKDISQESLTQAAAWCIGEYGDSLLANQQVFDDADDGGEGGREELSQTVTPSEIVDLFSSILNSSYINQVSTQYIITALVKLTTRFTEAAPIDRIRRILYQHQVSLDEEVQERAVVFSNLFGQADIRVGVLEKMPPPQIKEESRVLGAAATGVGGKSKGKSRKTARTNTGKTAGGGGGGGEDLLFDLMDDGSGATPTSSTAGPTNTDLLADILGGPSAASPGGGGGAPSNSLMELLSSPTDNAPAAASSDMLSLGAVAATPQAQTKPAAVMDVFGGANSSSGVLPPAVGHACYHAKGLRITIQTQRNAAGLVQATAHFVNTSAVADDDNNNNNDDDGTPSPATLRNVMLQAAVPKSQQLQLQAISQATLEPGAQATQVLRVAGAKGPLRLRLRISFTSDALGSVLEQVNWTEPQA